MPERRPFRILVVASGTRPLAAGDAMAALAAHENAAVDELHVLLAPSVAAHLRPTLLKSGWPSAVAETRKRLGITRNNMNFGRRTIHGVVPTDIASLADEVLDVLRRVCADDINEVTVVAASDAGAVSILAHSALQLVGRPRDRFFVLDHEGRRDGAPPALAELPVVFAERMLSAASGYQQLAGFRRAARLRLSEPGALTLNGARRTIRVDDLELVLPRLQFFWMFALASLAPRSLPLRSLIGNFSVVGHRVAVSPNHPERADLAATVAHLERVFALLMPHAADDFPMMFKRACGTAPGLPSVVAKINACLKRALDIGAAPYLIAGGRGTSGYRVTLPPARILLEPALDDQQSARA